MDYIKNMFGNKAFCGFVRNAATLTACALVLVGVAATMDSNASSNDTATVMEESSSDDGSAPGRYLAELNIKENYIQSVIVTFDNSVEAMISNEFELINDDIADNVASTDVTETTENVMSEAVVEKETIQVMASTEKMEEHVVSGSEYVLKFTPDDYKVLCTIVEAEAGDQDDIGKILVANVIINRVKSAKFPDNITDVVFQKNGKTYQFSPTRPGGRYYKVTADESTIQCVERALKGEDYSEGAIYFAMKTSSNSWFNRRLNFLFKHGDHYFYKDK